MATSFLRWMDTRLGNRPVRDWIYAAGEPALVTEVEDYVRRPGRFGVTPFDTVVLEGDGLVWPDFQRALAAGTLMASQRLIVIRDAEKVHPDIWHELMRWGRRHALDDARNRNVLATSYERVRLSDDDARYLAFVKHKHTQHIDCSMPADSQITYVSKKLFGKGSEYDRVSGEVVQRCGGELSRLRAECEKLITYCQGRPPTLADVELIVSFAPGESFVRALVAGKRAEAARRAPMVVSVPMALGALDWNIYNLHMIRKLKADFRVGRHVPIKAIADRLGLAFYQVKRMEPWATSYDVSATRRRLELVVQAHLTHAKGEESPSRLLLPLVSSW